MEQLKEVYGLKPETFDQVVGQLSLDATIVSKIDINTITTDILKQHPYFKNPVANTIISYREEHGAFRSPEELKNVDAVTDSIFEKIIPYLRF